MFDVVCTTVNGGIPIFYRRSSNQTDSVPFTTFSTLNAVITFADVQNVKFKTIQTDKHSFVWHGIGESLIVAGIGDLNKSTIKAGLELISTLVTMIIGDENVYNKNADRIKREIKNCLYNWSETIQSDLCWIIVDKKLCAATKDWWDLNINERKLLVTIILATCHNQNASADIPIFLPHSSSKILLRLVCCMIVQGVWIAAICGPSPNLDDIEISASKCFRTVINYFRPNQTKFELASGFIIIHKNSSKFLQSSYSISDVLTGIIQFYIKTASRLMTDDIMANEVSSMEKNHYYYAIQSNDIILCLAYPKKHNIITIRYYAKQTFQQLVSDINI